MVASAEPPTRPSRPAHLPLPLQRLQRRLSGHGARLGRFALVGASGVVVNSLVLFILVEAARLPHVLAATLSTESAILANFALNDRWTFRDVAPSVNWVARAARYNLVCLGGLLISVGVLAALTHWRHLHYLLANLAGVGAGLIWNYSGSSRLAWSRSPSRPPTRIAPSSPAPRSKASHRWPQSGDARGPKAEPIKEAVHP